MTQLLASIQQPSDEQLVQALARGQHEVLGTLYARYAGLIFSVAVQSLGSAAAEEVVQDTFLAVWRGAAAFDPGQGPFRQWVLRQAHWRVLNELRRRRRHPEAEAPSDPIADDEPSPEEHVWRDERAQVIRDALGTLSDKQRQAVALAFMEDMTHEQVAQALGVPLGTAKTRIRDGVQRLRSVLMPISAALVLVLAAGAGILQWLQQQHQLQQNQRAVALLTSSTVTAIRVESVTGAETHALYRFEPGTDLAVVSISHAAPGDYDVQARIDGTWVPLGHVTAGDDGRGALIAKGANFARAPDAIQVAHAGEVVLEWHAV